MNNPSDKTPMSRRGLLASALAAGTVGALAGSAAPAAAADEPPYRAPEESWIKGSGLKFVGDWVPLPADYPWHPGRIIYYTVLRDENGENARRQWAVVLPDGSQRSFPETAFYSQVQMAFAERGWRWESPGHPAAGHVIIYMELQDFLAAGLGNAPAIA